MSAERRIIRLGTRGSELALAQAALTSDAIKEIDSAIDVDVVVIIAYGNGLGDVDAEVCGKKAESLVLSGVNAEKFEIVRAGGA